MAGWPVFRAFQPLVARVPLAAAYAAAGVVVPLASPFARRPLGHLRANLRRVLPELSTVELERLLRANLREYLRDYVDLMRLPSVSTPELAARVEFEGEANLWAALSHGRGALFLSVHAGPWELVAAAAGRRLVPASILAEELQPPAMMEWYRRTRGRFNLSVLPLNRGGLRQALKALERNEIVVAAIDRDILGSGARLDFFGAPAPIPTGPASIALRRSVPIIPFSARRLPDGRCLGEAGEPILPHQTGGDLATEVSQLTARVLRLLEARIRAHPDQWHVLHSIWEPKEER
ncbi:MAG TPA: hypothetical protein VNG93_02945 [Candidatus Dormibacteraeota bacterium]|nr:hypothetical protein [Candidatus Dormibacteraeota bacterium]